MTESIYHLYKTQTSLLEKSKMKKTELKKEEPFISEDCLVEALHFLFCPTLEEEDPELSAFVNAIVVHPIKLDMRGLGFC